MASKSSFSSSHTPAGSPRHASAAVFSPAATPGTPTSTSHSSHRYHHQNCSKNSVESKVSRSTKTSGDETRTAATPMSSLLQERLLRERQSEGERSRTASDVGLSASLGDLRDRNIRDSPILRSATTTGDKTPADGAAEQGEHKGFGVKEMEQALSTLHKQNFDLKLELYHRRERQTALEGRLEELEAEQAETKDNLSHLQFELDARDKAISEAVAMIVQLETTVEELTREREMVRQVEAGGPFSLPNLKQFDDADRSTTPRPQPKHLPRMPSFLSDHSEQTENLRNVVLASRKSFVHTRNTSDGSAAAQSEFNRMTSPSLSVLSESSFASVYGGSAGYEYISALEPAIKVITEDRPAATPLRRRRQESVADLKGAAAADVASPPNQKGRMSSMGMHSLNQLMDSEYPLIRTRQMDTNLAANHESGSPRLGSRGQGLMTPSPPRAGDLQSSGRAPRGGRGALQNVNTAAAIQKEHGSYQHLPPTPDTVASSVLRKHPGVATSGDSLAGQFAANGHFHHPEWTGRPREGSGSATRQSSRDMNGQLASLTAFTSGHTMPQINTDVLIASFSATGKQQVRPHSATATSSIRERANSWASDSDSDGGADAHSEDDMDYWLQESYKPNKPAARRLGLAADEDRPPSPDLFSFPANGSGWQPDQIFGALHGTGVVSTPVASLKRDPLEEMSSALNRDRRLAEVQVPGPNQPPPPTPHRISSLHARTGSTDGITITKKKKGDRTPLQNSRRFSITGDKNRSYSMDTATQTSPPKGAQAVRQHSDGGESGKKPQYPPIAGQTTRGRINAFFKRAGSLSLAPGALAGVAQQSQPPPSPAADRTSSLRASLRDGRCSVPPPSPRPWPVNRQLSDTMQEDLQSATPPPILRSRAPSQVVSHEDSTTGPKDLQTDGAQDLGTAAAQGGHEDAEMEAQAGGGAPVQGKRRWLGLGRKSSLKNRAVS
ncbi:hypothetical protein Micbo1qcDRAFT_197945 [Microdochium bolleyi]|uniref:Centrosomin N-terminal motif 1 domain-containing protein n=1 Tax=Microdochium bolleyi TaxID=196109 RepID=A0A136IQ14_9PEZI|nr:hypothetical protein Micbo1qcDRAFT_197945 [Microdochium bolleyi]